PVSTGIPTLSKLHLPRSYHQIPSFGTTSFHMTSSDPTETPVSSANLHHFPTPKEHSRSFMSAPSHEEVPTSTPHISDMNPTFPSPLPDQGPIPLLSPSAPNPPSQRHSSYPLVEPQQQQQQHRHHHYHHQHQNHQHNRINSPLPSASPVHNHKVARRPWTKAEQEALYVAVERFKLFGRWREIKVRMGLDRTANEIGEEYMRLYGEILDSEDDEDMNDDEDGDVNYDSNDEANVHVDQVMASPSSIASPIPSSLSTTTPPGRRGRPLSSTNTTSRKTASPVLTRMQPLPPMQVRRSQSMEWSQPSGERYSSVTKSDNKISSSRSSSQHHQHPHQHYQHHPHHRYQHPHQSLHQHREEHEHTQGGPSSSTMVEDPREYQPRMFRQHSTSSVPTRSMDETRVSHPPSDTGATNEVKPTRTVRVWTQKQSEQLKSLIEDYFPGGYRINWVWVASQMGNTFTRKQCKNKWEIMRRRAGTEEEVNQLKLGFQEFGPSWSQIQEKYLPERSQGSIAIMWDLLQARESGLPQKH
ncbi:hypothetical protein BGZ94_004646, partial [Podila epigama]